MQELDVCETPLFLRIHGADRDCTFKEVEVFEVRLSIACVTPHRIEESDHRISS
jgi:hypothetical protein